MKDNTARLIPLACLAGLIIYIGSLCYEANHMDESPMKNTIGGSSSSSVSDGFTGHVCAECGSRCIQGKEIQSSGDIVSNYESYYLCGDMNCVENRYRKVKRARGSNEPSSHQRSSIPDYVGGSDGRLYETKPCGLCNGTGIESNAYGDYRVCPMCDGKGHQNY